MKAKRRKRRHWYRMYVGECCACGRDQSYRERVYGRRPKRASGRYVHLPDSQTYDHCLEYEY
jgi:hypothetical protein